MHMFEHARPWLVALCTVDSAVDDEALGRSGIQLGVVEAGFNLVVLLSKAWAIFQRRLFANVAISLEVLVFLFGELHHFSLLVEEREDVGFCTV
jgi:hypothetical protein